MPGMNENRQIHLTKKRIGNQKVVKYFITLNIRIYLRRYSKLKLQSHIY